MACWIACPVGDRGRHAQILVLFLSATLRSTPGRGAQLQLHLTHFAHSSSRFFLELWVMTPERPELSSLGAAGPTPPWEPRLRGKASPPPAFAPCLGKAVERPMGEGTCTQTLALALAQPEQPLLGTHMGGYSLPPSPPLHSVTQDLSCCHIQSQSQLSPHLLSLTCHSQDFKCHLALGDSDIYQ